MLDLIGLSAMQIGRINKWCDTQVKYKGHIVSQLDVLKERVLTGNAVKECTNNEYKWNRHRFNKMGSCKEQDDYELKLKEGRTYWVCFGEYSTKIPKIVFDVLNLPTSEGSIMEVTKMKQLSAKQFDRCNDVIFTADYIKFYFKEQGEFVEIKNLAYLADIRRVYRAPKGSIVEEVYSAPTNSMDSYTGSIVEEVYSGSH